jgi:PST family polysaccharide transporter
MQFRYTVTADWTDTIVGALVTVGFALKGHGYWSFVYGHLTGLVVRVILQMYLAAWTPKFTVSRAALNDLLSFGFGIQAKRLLEYASSNLDNLVVGRVLGMSALGIYDKAFTTMNKMVVRLTLGHAPFRIFSIIHEDAERFRRAYARLILSITLLGYPLMAGCIVMAKPLFALLYGQRWSAAVFPFQLLCAGGMLKLLNAYASQANEAAGNIWRQTWRQAFGTVLVVIGAAVGSRWGLSGAAVGVLVAIAALTIAMQDLVRDATGLTWRGLLTPQIPALTCAALLVGVLLGTGALLRIALPSPAPWQQVLVQGTAGAIFYAAFMLANPFAAVHDVVSETLNDLLPAGSARFLNRFRRPVAGQHA